MKKIIALLLVISTIIVSFGLSAVAASEEEKAANQPDIYIRFDEEEKYSGVIDDVGNDMTHAGFNSEKKCEILRVNVSGDPYIAFNMNQLEDTIDLDEYGVIQFGIGNLGSNGTNGHVFYLTTSSTSSYNQNEMTNFSFSATENFQAVTIDLTKTKKWTGELVNLRLDVFGACSNACDVELYYIAFFKDKKVARAFGTNFAAEGDAAYVEPTLKPTAEPTPTPEPVVTDEPTTEPEVIATKAPETTSGGCNGIIAIPAVFVAASAMIFIKKKKQ